MNKLLVVGIGSPYGSDQIGWWLVEQLEKSYLSDREQNKRIDFNVDFKILDRPGAQLLNEMAGYQQVLIFDAMKSHQPPGTIHPIALTDLPKIISSCDSHGFTLVDTLKLGASLDQLPQQWVLMGIEVGSQTKEVLLNVLSESGAVEQLWQSIANPA